MVIKLDNVNEWNVFPLDKALVLHGTKLRRIRLELNTTDPVRVSLLKGSLRDEIRFLATVSGMETIDFIDAGNVHVVLQPLVEHDDVEVYYYTADGEAVSSPVEDREIFTRMHARSPRNPELELMQRKLMENQERLFGRIQQDHQLQVRELERQFEAERAAREKANERTEEPSGTSAGSSGTEVSQSDDASGDGEAEQSSGKPKPKSGKSA